MPICKREGFENFSDNNNSNKRNTFHDNEKVFYCETTKQIFREYEDYFRHVMVINSTIWQCEITKRENLTYAEALKSERRAMKKREQFKDYLRPIVLLVVEKAQQSSMKTLCRLMYQFLRSRYFINEEVEATQKKNGSTFNKYVVTGIAPSSPSKSPTETSVHDPEKLIYTLRKIDGVNSGNEFKMPYDQIRRSRFSFNHENLKMYTEDNVVRVEGILRPKPDSYKKYVTDRKVTFAKLFIGKLPFYEPSRPRNLNIKQSSMSKYLTKNGGTELEAPAKTKAMIAAEEAAREERAQNLLKEMERLRKEKEEKQAELERKKAERLAKIEEEAVALARKTDDLERIDQKPLPRYQTIVTNIPTKYFGDALVVNEFMNSFSTILCGNNVFRNKISFFELTRAFTSREIVGPLSDIVLILIGTIFGLQREEEQECAVDYIRIKQHNDQEPYKTMDEAAEAHEFVSRHYSTKLNQLPLDAHTISEVLRLHLLASGANVSEKSERYRLTYRNGYYSTEDPGLVFRRQQPHVLRALKMYTIYQLPMVEIFRILNILIAQILSYSSTINLVEERMEATAKAKIELKAIVAAERQRVSAVEVERKKVIAEFATQALEQPADATQLEEKMNKKVAEILALSARENKKFKDQLTKLHRSMFDYMIFLGMDRLYRKYYVLESIPGVFVEHSLESMDVCSDNPPKNVPHLVGVPKTLKEIRAYLTKMYQEEDKKNKKKSTQSGPNKTISQENKENKENQAVVTNGDVKLNGDATKMEVDGEVEPEPVVVPPEPPTQYELLMCTGDPKNCYVHDPKNPDHQRWAYFYKEEDIDAVINGLNPLGERESLLKENLMTMRELIVEHTKKCPVDVLSMESEKTTLFSRFKLQIKNETKRKYNSANFGFPDDHDLNEVMYAMLVDRVLQFEIDITTGDLGKLKVKDLEKWRSDIQNNTYDPQQELQWGGEQAKKPFKDPGHSLGETLEIDSEDSADEGISLHDSSLLRRCVKNLSSALLQIEQGIEQKFMKEPFGTKKDKYDKTVEPILEKGRERLKEWEISLMHSTSYSQVFLHLNILHGAIKWQRSTNKSLCVICRRGTDPEKMLLCDHCNGGTHMFCMKPKMKTVPEGNWYCSRCVNNLGLSNEKQEPKKKKQKRAFVMDEEDMASVGSSQSNGRRQSRRRHTVEEVEEVEEELCNDDEEVENDDENDEENDAEGDEEDEDEQEDTINGTNGEMEEDSGSEDDEICAVCSYNGGEISCAGCKSVYHLDCADLRRAPRGSWSCKTCRNDQSKKRKSKQNDESTDDEDYEQPLAKRARSSASGSNKRSSVRNSMHDSSYASGSFDDSMRQYNNNNNNNRRRRAENLPLNSSLLYDLLDEIMKNDNSWPFLRPVMHSEVPDYHTIIKEPMDFAKVKSKLNMGKYTINEELLKDIELVFKNCDIYNQEGNEIYEAGSSLEKFVMQRCKEYNLPFHPSDMNRL